MRRREFFRTALALPAAGLFAPFAKLTAADLGKVRITGIKIKPIAGVGHTIIPIDTDADLDTRLNAC